nr:hypothetical protein [Saprospiraceae bacterium]
MKYFSFISLGILIVSMLWTSAGESEGSGVPLHWDHIDSLQAIGKLQSALEGTEIILEHAFENKDRENYLRAVFYRIALTDRLYPDQKERVIESLYAEMERCGDIVTAVLKSILAEYFMMYYSAHRWTIDGRTEMEGDAPEDLNSWTANHFFHKASQLYLQSLETDLTKEVSNESLGWVVTADSTGKLFRPSLYHLLFHRALEFFEEADNLYQKARPFTTVDSREYFGAAQDFIELNFAENDREEVDFSTRALLLYQRGLKEALDAGDIDVLADLDLHRIRYLHSVCRGGNCDEYYLQALKEFAERYSETAVQAEIIFYIADFYKNRGDRYDHNPNNPDRWAYKTALDWAHKAINQWPKELRTGRNENLIQQIQQSTFSFISESVNCIDEEFLISLQYKNIESIRYEIYKIESFDPRLQQATNAERIKEAFSKIVPQRTGRFDLPDTEDYQNHRIELPMPRLGVGNYYLLIQDEEEAENSFKLLRWADFQVTNLTVLNLREDYTDQAVFVVDRLTGEPVADAKVEVMTSDYNRRERRNVQRVEYTGKTNSDGFMKFKSTENSGRYFLRISHLKDTFITPENYRYSTRNRKSKSTERIGFFLDRSIYRPGQIVYFKGIASQSENEVSSTPIVSRPIELSVRDVNHKEVHRISVRTNKYGAFSGNFTLPQGLTGRMSIVPEGFSQRGIFSVEEYKRPTFFVEIDAVKGGYQLGDTLHITGKAQAYSGFPVRDARVSYQVSRRIHFPWWRERSYFLPPFYRQSISLQQGEIQTDEQGKFFLQFAAEGVEDLKDCQYCTYSYEVVITATDAAGEVRSSQKVFNISQIPVVAEVDFPDDLDRSGKMKGVIEIKNLDGSQVDRKVRVEWTKLIPPSTEVVSRLYQRPTQFYLSESEFKKRFPYLPYANELDPANWQLAKPSLSKEMKTGEKTSLSLPKNSRVGKYRLTIQDLELADEPVIYVKDYSVFDSDNGLTSGVDPMEIVANKAFFTPGENLNLFLGSRLKNFKLLSVLEYTDGFSDYQWRSIQPGETSIQREIAEGDRGGFYYHFIGLYRGRVFPDRHFVKVPFGHKKINIEPLEYTAENQPGIEQKWKFKLTDWKGKPIQARVLASMYDSSLDAIVPHQWSLNLYFDRQSHIGLSHGMGSLLSNSRGYDSYPREQVSDYGYPTFNNKNYLWRYGFTGMRMGHPEAMDLQAAPSDESDDGEPADQAKMVTEQTQEMPVEELQPEAPQLRENFDETVFFFPEVESDENGVFELDFVMGESMTEWKLQILALTEDYKNGLKELKATTSSDLIVLPNWPRFVMQGDGWRFPVRLINNTDSPLEGMLSITVKNALSGEELTAAVVEESQVPFSIGANGSEIRFFHWNIPSDQIGLLSVEVFGSTPAASD